MLIKTDFWHQKCLKQLILIKCLCREIECVYTNRDKDGGQRQDQIKNKGKRW